MEKRNEKQPVDDLFARKLKTMSLPPGPDGFERLQARMEQSAPNTKGIFWRSLVNRQYMAIAACLLLTCLFGWLYLPTETPMKVVVAANKSVEQLLTEPLPYSATNTGDRLAKTSSEPERKQVNSVTPQPAVPASTKLSKQPDDSRLIAKDDRSGRGEESPRNIVNAVPSRQTHQLAKEDLDVYFLDPVNDQETITTVTKPVLTAERVLVVTIAEPEVLSVARRTTAAIADENAAPVTEQSDKESKTAGFWNQMKRLKQGEIFARKDVANDERGLLGRAYSGLKQSLDKDKSVKQ